MEFLGSITCSNGLFVLMPFPPKKIQLSLKPKVPITELPRSEIRCLASSLSLQRERNKKDPHYFLVTCKVRQPAFQIINKFKSKVLTLLKRHRMRPSSRLSRPQFLSQI